MALSSSKRQATTTKVPAAEPFRHLFDVAPEHEHLAKALAPNVGATQDVSELLGGRRGRTSLLVSAVDNTPSSLGVRPLQQEGRAKARRQGAAGNEPCSVYVLEQMCGFPMGNGGWRRADKAFQDPVPEGNGSPLGNALHQALDATEHFLRSATGLGAPVHAVVFAPALDWLTNCEPADLIASAAKRTEALAAKVGKRFFVQPVVVGADADLDAAKLFAFQRQPLALQEIDYAKFYLWLVQVSQQASGRGGDFIPPQTDFLKPLK